MANKGIRVISLRKANKREVKQYEQKSTPELMDDDTQQWRAENTARAVSFDALPQSLRGKIARRGERGTQKSPTQISTTIRLSPEVSSAFRATGKGWQTRIDAALNKEWLSTHSPRAE